MTSKLPEEAAFSPQGCYSPLDEGKGSDLVEPSNDEQSQWSEATEAYVRGLEERIEALEADNARLVKANGLRMDELHKERAEAKLWFERAQEWRAKVEALEAALRDLLPEAINDRYITQSDAVRNAQALLEGIAHD